jgi:nucleotide-binding universal stress UspA family protein
MRALVWIVEETGKATAATAATLLPADADVTLLYVRPSDAETVARGARYGLLGRSRRATADDARDSISQQAASALLSEAQAVLGRTATLDVRSGRIEHEVVAAAETMDLLALARDEDHPQDRPHRGPRTLGPTTRYVVDHAPCAVLLVWPEARSA